MCSVPPTRDEAAHGWGTRRYIAKALGAVARAWGGVAQLARDTAIAREALYRTLSETGNPELGTVLKVVHALGVRLSATLVA